MREVDLLKGLQHKNILPLLGYRVGDTVSDNILVMKWKQRGCLGSNICHRQPISSMEKRVFVGRTSVHIGGMYALTTNHPDQRYLQWRQLPALKQGDPR